MDLTDLDLEEFQRILNDAEERLSFNPTAHRYRLDSKPIPNVTSILNSWDKPLLDMWRVRVQQEADIRTAWETLELGLRTDNFGSFENFSENFKKAAGEKYEHERISDAAKDTGKQMHALLEQHSKALLGIPYEIAIPISDEAQTLFSGVLDWMRHADFTPLGVERRVFSLKYWYGGTVDLFALSEGKKVVVDYKSKKTEGSRLWPEQEAQNCAYRAAAEEMGLGAWDGLLFTIPKDGGRVLPVPVSVPFDKGFGAFLACRTLWQYDKKTP